MADITKCCNKNCKIKEQCYRFTAKDNEYWQSYADFNDGKKIADKKECSSFYLDRRAKKRRVNMIKKEIYPKTERIKLEGFKVQLTELKKEVE